MVESQQEKKHLKTQEARFAIKKRNDNLVGGFNPFEKY